MTTRQATTVTAAARCGARQAARPGGPAGVRLRAGLREMLGERHLTAERALRRPEELLVARSHGLR